MFRSARASISQQYILMLNVNVYKNLNNRQKERMLIHIYAYRKVQENIELATVENIQGLHMTHI